MHIAARVLGQAAAGEILVSSAVRDLVAGSGTGFEDRGSVELRACPAPGNSWPSMVMGRGRNRLRRDWRQRLPPALEPQCAGRTALSK